MGPSRILFVRHAQSVGNKMTQDQRATYEVPNHAYPLTDLGEKQAAITGLYLKRHILDWTLKSDRPQLYFQSTFLRTQMTMEIIQREIGLYPRVITDSRLDEKWDGIFHELSKDNIERLYPEQLRSRQKSSYYHYRALGGESCPDTELRIRSFLLDPLVADKSILIVGHGRWAILLHKLLLDLTVDQFLKLKEEGLKDGGTENCSVIEYSRIPALNTWLYKCVVPWKGKLPEEKTEPA